MNKKIATTKGLNNYEKREFSIPNKFYVVKNNTEDNKPMFNLLDYRVSRLDVDEIRSVIMRAKKDYGKAFEKLAAED